MRSATTRLRGGSAAITIAVQPRRSASATMRFVALRVPSIVLVGPGPDWPQGLPQVLYTIFQERDALPTRITRGLSDRPPALDVKMRALARRLYIPYVAPLAALCNAHGCITRTGVGGNEITVWDTAHFTRAGSVLLARATERTMLSGIGR